MLLSKYLKGNRVGLFLGSFDPPHLGHMHIAYEAKKLLNLDSVLWVVAAANPFKEAPSQSLKERMKLCQDIFNRYPEISRGFLASDLELIAKKTYSYDFLKYLLERDKRRFILIAGSDTLRDMHRWHRGNEIPKLISIAMLPRLEYRFSKLHCHTLMTSKIILSGGVRVPLKKRKNTVIIFNRRMINISSTAIKTATRNKIASATTNKRTHVNKSTKSAIREKINAR